MVAAVAGRGYDGAMTRDISGRRATLYGVAAIAMWAGLALLTVATGAIPPFQLVAMTFAIGGLCGLGVILASGRSVVAAFHWPWRVWCLGIFGLFGYHFLYFTALRLAPPAEANLINYLWPLLIVLLAAPLAGERLRWWHVAGAAGGFAGVAVLAFGRGDLAFSGSHWVGYLAALGCAFAWSIYSVLGRRFGTVPTDAIAGYCVATSVLATFAHLALETTVVPAGPAVWLALAGLGVMPVGAAFYLWDVAVKRGDIRALGAMGYATPVLSTGLLVAAGEASASWNLLVAAALVVGGALLAGRDLWWPKA